MESDPGAGGLTGAETRWERDVATTLFERIARLVRADAHGMVEALEERGRLLRQHLREAELEVLQKRARVDALGLEAERLAEESERRRERARQLDEDVELALAGDKEPLARFAAGQLLSERAALEALERQRETVQATRERLAERLAKQEEALGALRSRARAWLASRAHARADADVFGEPAVADEAVELELMRRRAAPEGA